MVSPRLAIVDYAGAAGGGQLTSSAGTSKAEAEDLHGHNALALAAVDVGVMSEDVGEGLGGVLVAVVFDGHGWKRRGTEQQASAKERR